MLPKIKDNPYLKKKRAALFIFSVQTHFIHVRSSAWPWMHFSLRPLVYNIPARALSGLCLHSLMSSFPPKAVLSIMRQFCWLGSAFSSWPDIWETHMPSWLDMTLEVSQPEVLSLSMPRDPHHYPSPWAPCWDVLHLPLKPCLLSTHPRRHISWR